ncbi:MAG: ABC transporter substrate-binding protein [bacterium]|nr:ABC transporter substrate-binding protein [bacterium]
MPTRSAESIHAGRHPFTGSKILRPRWSGTGLLLILAAVFGFSGGCRSATPRDAPSERITQQKSSPAAPELGDEIRIGWFGPTDPHLPDGRQMWAAASLAIETANREGGFQGRPFRLVPVWSENPWGSGVKGVTRLVYEDRVWAIVGAVDGAGAHLVEQVVAKARVTFLDPVSTDDTANSANVPWIFSCAPGDRALAAALADRLLAAVGNRSFALVSSTAHDERLFATALARTLAQRGAFPALHLQFSPGTDRYLTHLERLVAVRPVAVVAIAGPSDTAGWVQAIREAGIDVPLYGGPRVGRARFLEQAGRQAEGMTFPVLWREVTAKTFTEAFSDRYETKPDYAAFHSYDAVNLLVAAIRKAGLNREAIRDAVRALSPWAGVSGAISWSPNGRNTRAVGLAEVREGRYQPVDGR